MELKYIAFLICIIFILPLAGAISDDAITAGNELDDLLKDMKEMRDAGFQTIRYNDTLTFARQIYDAQLALENASGKADYSLVIEKIKELRELKITAIRASDELKALEMTMNQTRDVNMTQVISIYDEARDEFNSERYEESMKHIDEAYKKISELEALRTKINAIYEASTRSIAGFLREQWKRIAAIVVVLVMTGLMARRKIAAWIISQKIRSLERRRNSITGLISKTQQEYFGDGAISETTYYARTKKYAELIRDINRQIPLLKEELMKKQGRIVTRTDNNQAGMMKKSDSKRKYAFSAKAKNKQKRYRVV